MTRDDMNFFEELESLTTDEGYQPFSFTLVSGERYEVTGPRQFTTFRYMYVFYSPDGRQILFPFPNVCSVEIHAEPKVPNRS